MIEVTIKVWDKENSKFITLGGKGLGSLGWDFDTAGIDNGGADEDFEIAQIEINGNIEWTNPEFVGKV